MGVSTVARRGMCGRYGYRLALVELIDSLRVWVIRVWVVSAILCVPAVGIHTGWVRGSGEWAHRAGRGVNGRFVWMVGRRTTPEENLRR